ncbi:MAG TPA: amidase family protein [Ktedonobacteraceae bacterium]
MNFLATLGYSTREIEAPVELPSLDLVNIEANRIALSQALFQEIDVLLLPTTTDIPPSIEAATAGGAQAVAPDNTFFCNYYGLPALSLPCGFSSNGLPLGFQVVGPRQGENTVLSVAHTFQQATQWHMQHPSF